MDFLDFFKKHSKGLDYKEIYDASTTEKAYQARQMQEGEYYRQMQLAQLKRGIPSTPTSYVDLLGGEDSAAGEEIKKKYLEMIRTKEARESCKLCGKVASIKFNSLNQTNHPLACDTCLKGLVTAEIGNALATKKICEVCKLHFTRCLCNKSDGLKKLKQ